MGWARGTTAGRVRVDALFLTSAGNTGVGEKRLFEHAEGDYEWNAARAVQLTLRHPPPEEGEGVASLDDLALVARDRSTKSSALKLETPHARDFVRVGGAAGKRVVRVTLRTHRSE